MTCKSTALCLFDEKNVQMDITGNAVHTFHPVTAITGTAPIEFHITAGDTYLDLGDLQVLLHLKITKSKGTFDASTDKISFVNLPISSIFQDVHLSLGDTEIEGGQHHYPYNGYLSTLLQFHPSAKKTHLEAWGWHEDTPGQFDDEANNEGFKLRQAECGDGSTWEVMGPLFLDMTRQARYLLPKTDVRLKLKPASREFVLHFLGTGTGNEFNYAIEKCVLYARKISVLDDVISGHNRGLEKFNAKYFLNHVDIKTWTLNSGVKSFIKESLYTAQMPKLLVIGLLEHDAFDGNIKKSPFNFQHFDLNKIIIQREGELVPGIVHSLDYANNQYMAAYNYTMSALNYFNTDDTNGITLEHFKQGFNLYAYDLTPDGTYEGPHRHLTRTGSLRLELQFENTLKKPIKVLMFAILDAKLELTKLREVVMSYTK